MLERVARALCKAGGINPDECVMGSGSISYGGGATIVCHRRAWEDRIPQALAAIRTMREPTQPMMAAGDAWANHHADDVYEIWHVMIDEALR